MQLQPGTYCPLIHDECIQFKCMFWTHLRGLHPQTGQELDEYDCAVRWLPLLMIEGAKETRQAAAAIESFRNVTIKGLSQIPVLAVPVIAHQSEGK